MIDIDTSSAKGVKQIAILQKLLEHIVKNVSVNGIGFVVSKKECLAEIPGKKAKARVSEIINDYNYVFMVYLDEFKENADKAQRLISESFKKNFGKIPKSYKMLTKSDGKTDEKSYVILIPVSFALTLQEPQS